MDFGNLVKNPAIVVGLVRALLLVAVALGLNVSSEQEAVILGAVSLALTGVTVFFTVGKAQVVETNNALGLYTPRKTTKKRK